MYDNINSNDHHLIPPSAGSTFDQCIELYEHIWEAGSRLVYLHSKSITAARGEQAGDQFSSKRAKNSDCTTARLALLFWWCTVFLFAFPLYGNTEVVHLK